MVVYQPPVLELPVPIGAYRSVNGFVCIATSVVLLVSRMEKKYLLSGNMLNQKFFSSLGTVYKSSNSHKWNEKWVHVNDRDLANNNVPSPYGVRDPRAIVE